MKLLGVCGSPRKGNTEWMLRKFLEAAAKSGVETEIVLLKDKDIKWCSGCLSCDAGGKDRKGVCKIKDDMQQLLPKMIEADGIAFGTPVYFELVSGLLKNFMDRTCPIWPKLEKKPIVGIAVAESGIGKAVENIKTYASLCNMRWIGDVTALARDPRQVSKEKDIEPRLKKLAEKLIRTMQE
jgi:multimeric flavodoxin WrbA